MESSRRRLRAAGIALAILIVLSLLVWMLARPGTDWVEGEVDATQVDVAAKIAARVDSLYVERGQTVHRGDLLATLHSPEIEAKLTQATSAERAAEAQHAKAERGAREEEIRAARSQWQRADAAAALAESTYRRIERLHRDGVVATQRRESCSRASCDTARMMSLLDACDGATPSTFSNWRSTATGSSHTVSAGTPSTDGDVDS